MTDEYKSIKEKSEGFFKDRNSKFIAFAYPINEADEIKAILDDLRKQFHDARHFCYAYVLGIEQDIYRANDDGEPAGSAGLPIYRQILSSELTNVFVVVIRYFGGTKLGVPGLINAYKTATKDAFDNAVIVKKYLTKVYTIQYPYELTNEVQRLINDTGAKIVHQEFTEICKQSMEIRLKNEEIFLQKTAQMEALLIVYV